MKRWVSIGALLAVLTATPAGAVQVGIGLAAGASFPLAQSDNGNGDQYGLRLPVNVLPLLTVEPFLTSTSLGRVDASFAGHPYNRRGFDILAYGAIAALGGVGMGPRLPIYPFVGIGSYHLGREGSADDQHLGYTVGLGYARALPVNLAVNARGDIHWIDIGETARRFFEISLGVTMRFHPGPEED